MKELEIQPIKVETENEKNLLKIIQAQASIIYSFDNIIHPGERNKVWREIRLMKSLRQKLGINYRDAYTKLGGIQKVI